MLRQSVIFMKRRAFTYHWKHQKLFVCTRCCIHWRCSWWSCLSSPQLHHQPACSSALPLVCWLCHVSERPVPSLLLHYDSIISAAWKSTQEYDLTVKHVFPLQRGPLVPIKARGHLGLKEQRRPISDQWCSNTLSVSLWCRFPQTLPQRRAWPLLNISSVMRLKNEL